MGISQYVLSHCSTFFSRITSYSPSFRLRSRAPRRFTNHRIGFHCLESRWSCDVGSRLASLLVISCINRIQGFIDLEKRQHYVRERRAGGK
jgi:hypothetical protein